MDTAWIIDGHRLQVRLDTASVQLSIICPHDPGDLERECSMSGDDGEYILDCWVNFNVKEFGLEILENPLPESVLVEGPIDIKWRQTGDEDDIMFWLSFLTKKDLEPPEEDDDDE